jgi:hypothetical protein
MEELKVSFVISVLRKGFKSFLNRLRFETITSELLVYTILVGIFESSMDKQLSFTIQGVLFFLLSLSINTLLIELVFRLMKVIKNGKAEST